MITYKNVYFYSAELVSQYFLHVFFKGTPINHLEGNTTPAEGNTTPDSDVLVVDHVVVLVVVVVVV